MMGSIQIWFIHCSNWPQGGNWMMGEHRSNRVQQISTLIPYRYYLFTYKMHPWITLECQQMHYNASVIWIEDIQNLLQLMDLFSWVPKDGGSYLSKDTKVPDLQSAIYYIHGYRGCTEAADCVLASDTWRYWMYIIMLSEMASYSSSSYWVVIYKVLHFTSDNDPSIKSVRLIILPMNHVQTNASCSDKQRA